MTATSIFISYAPQDSVWAQELAGALRALGQHVCFKPSEERFGERWPETIEDELQSSDVVVVIVNEDQVTQRSNLFELGAAASAGKRLLPVVPLGVNAAEIPIVRKQPVVLEKTTPVEVARLVVTEIEHMQLATA